MTGARTPLKVADGEVALSFAPYASRVVVFRRDGQALPPPAAVPTELVSSDELRTGWKASFAGEPGWGCCFAVWGCLYCTVGSACRV